MLKINGITGNYGTIRAQIRGKYNYGPFTKTITYQVTDAKGRKTVKTVDVKKKITTAWRFVTTRAAAHRPCNLYFQRLPGKKSLAQLLKQRIVLHALVPRKGYTDQDLPRGAGSVSAIGLNLLLFVDKGTAEMQATLIHELAHLGGASTDSTSLQAENALKHCLMPKHFDPKAVGERQQTWPSGRDDVRLV